MTITPEKKEQAKKEIDAEIAEIADSVSDKYGFFIVLVDTETGIACSISNAKRTETIDNLLRKVLAQHAKEQVC